MPEQIHIFLADTCIISDFINCKFDCLNELKKRNCRILVLQEIYDELLKNFDASELESHYIEVINAEIDEYEQMLNINSLRLSAADKLCIAVAQTRGLCCVTKDKLLHSKCIKYGINVKWGLELLADLCEIKVIDKDIARDWGRAIYELDDFIEECIYSKFLKKLKI